MGHDFDPHSRFLISIYQLNFQENFKAYFCVETVIGNNNFVLTESSLTFVTDGAVVHFSSILNNLVL